MKEQPEEQEALSGGALRLFLAVPLPPPILAEMTDLSGRLQKGLQFSTFRPSWSRPESMHLTLLFLGRTEPDRVDPIIKTTQAVAARFAPLRLEIKRLGVFPQWRSPRVLWVGVRERTHQLAELHRRLGGALATLGYEPEAREYHPHLTLARIKSLKGVSALQTIVESHQGFKFGPFQAGELVLYSSRLAAGGATHTVLAQFPFAASTPEVGGEAGAAQ